MEFKLLQLRANIKSAFENPNLGISFAIVIIASLLFEFLSFAEKTITGFIYSIISQLVLFILFAGIFFIIVKLARKDASMQQLLSAFSFLWLYLIIAAVLTGIGFFVINQSPVMQFASIAIANNFSVDETVLGINLMQEKDREQFNSLLELNALNEAEKAKALQLFDAFNVNPPYLLVFLILLLLASFFLLVALLAVPYLIIRQAFKKSIAVNILLWIVIWSITLFIAINVVLGMNLFIR